MKEGLTLADKKILEQIKKSKTDRKTARIKQNILLQKRLESAAADFRKLNTELHGMLRKTFGNDLPLKQIGLTPAQVQESNIAALNEICTKIQAFQPDTSAPVSGEEDKEDIDADE